MTTTTTKKMVTGAFLSSTRFLIILGCFLVSIVQIHLLLSSLVNGTCGGDGGGGDFHSLVLAFVPEDWERSQGVDGVATTTTLATTTTKKKKVNLAVNQIKANAILPDRRMTGAVRSGESEQRDGAISMPNSILSSRTQKNLPTLKDPQNRRPATRQLISTTAKNATTTTTATTSSSSSTTTTTATTTLVLEGYPSLRKLTATAFTRNPLCELLAEHSEEWGIRNVVTTRSGRSIPSRPTNPITINVTFGCGELYDKSILGTGNYLLMMYGMRLTAQVIGNVHLSFHCPDAQERKSDLILPWVMGWFPARMIHSTTNNNNNNTDTREDPGFIVHDRSGKILTLSIEEVCTRHPPIHFLLDDMKHELGRMAVSIAGPKQSPFARTVPANSGRGNTSRTGSVLHQQQQQQQRVAESTALISPPIIPERILQISDESLSDEPIIPNIVLDDAVLHFRCGDLLTDGHIKYGFMKFSSYVRIIHPYVRSIGIITQPFQGQSRRTDQKRLAPVRCKVLVSSLVEYLQKAFPRARITIHNDESETIVISYTRMILARQSIAGISTFAFFPALATLGGTGYIREPDHIKPTQYDIGNWLLHPRIDRITDTVILTQETKMLNSKRLVEIWDGTEGGEETILQWFWDDAIIIL